ncbi:MAG: branched-chain amino acid ABC transporter permease [Rhodospirillales bacterium]|nr:branched-chain amino acid ABC transporter permease [Rhodospirillales bacterium]
MELLLQSIINGLIQGGFFSLFAVGLVLIFGVMKVVNFAHGELVMVGAFTIWLLHAQWGLSYIPAIGAAIILVTMIGLLMERFLFRPTRSDPLAGLICSIGVLFILQVGATLVGGDGPSKQVPPPYHGTLILFDLIRVPYQRVFSLAISSSALLALWFFLTRSRFGWALRAVAQDREASALQGINTDRISIIAIGIGAALAGLAGGLVAPLGNINPHMGHNVIVTAFIVTIVGGVGSLSGAVLAAVLYAMFHTLVTVYFGGTIATICGLVLMVIVLIVKPTGIMGVRISE